MLQYMLKSKIHRATVIEADLNYEGSLSIDKNLMDAVGLYPYERVNIYNINNGERFDTYVIEGKPGSGMIGLNGAAARKGLVGDLVIIVSYALYAPEELAEYKPKIVVLDKGNVIKNVMHFEEAQHPYRG
ncbi:MAG: aspartate 1-decarboxylase [Desulfurivibrio sp.]|nr:aspartate 1-decarboxylase [Desulfurivibrio sp.]MBU3937180.1 aspartate 1-decarboxylase [Pseudomonadota bacterium]MBU4034127.1 aspartate 1-decarboxylase [Pseudomonadota bacterium]MBU4117476.1 aspartate 1-decarboxylase [Pseudomonadota bacterium]